MTPKDIEITTVAILKSIIESGAPPEQWDELVKKGIVVYMARVRGWKEYLNNGK